MPTREEILAMIINQETLGEKQKIFSDGEKSWMNILVNRYQNTIDQTHRDEYQCILIEGHYRFKQIYLLYQILYRDQKIFSRLCDIGRWNSLMEDIMQKWHKEGRRSFSAQHYLQRVRDLGSTSEKYSFGQERGRKYLSWMLNFPIIPALSVEEVMESEVFPFNFPHIYMRAVEARIRGSAKDQKTDREIEQRYSRFIQREMKSKIDHNLWYFQNRVPGSYGSGKKS